MHSIRLDSVAIYSTGSTILVELKCKLQIFRREKFVKLFEPTVQIILVWDRLTGSLSQTIRKAVGFPYLMINKQSFIYHQI